MRGPLSSHDMVVEFALAGNARITLVSGKTGTGEGLRARAQVPRFEGGVLRSLWPPPHRTSKHRHWAWAHVREETRAQ